MSKEKRKILLVDDNPVAQKMTEKVFLMTVIKCF